MVEHYTQFWTFELFSVLLLEKDVLVDILAYTFLGICTSVFIG